ncbi:MAG: response regulator [Candidatus Omnitrophica bacterium]|nr:response regulator [Candidatus Omnitrophota bacterium]
MRKILIVEDSYENRELTAEILRDIAQCDVVSNANEAIDAYNASLTQKPYDLILLDIEMPGMDGLELLRKIRQSEEAAGIPLGEGVVIIMVTIHKKPFLDAFYQGCNDYILKPIDPKKLIQKVKNKFNTKTK